MNIKLIDFGLSNVFKPEQTLKTFCGSPTYAAPELVQRHEYAGPEVDCWSLGVLLYVFVCGELPFDGNSFNELYTHIIRAEYVMPPYISPACQDLIRHMLVPDPTKRYNIGQIVSHPWVVSGGYKPPDLRTITPKMGLSSKTPIDMEVLKKMEELGFEKSAVLKSLLNDSYDDAAATYYLLCSSLKNVRSRKTSIGKVTPPPPTSPRQSHHTPPTNQSVSQSSPSSSSSSSNKSPSQSSQQPSQTNPPASPRNVNSTLVQPIVVTKPPESNVSANLSSSCQKSNLGKVSPQSPRKERREINMGAVTVSEESDDVASGATTATGSNNVSVSARKKSSKTSSLRHRTRALSKESKSAALCSSGDKSPISGSDRSGGDGSASPSVAPLISLTTSLTSSSDAKGHTAAVNQSPPPTLIPQTIEAAAEETAVSSSTSGSKKKADKLSRFYTLRHSRHSRQKEDPDATTSAIAPPRKGSISSIESSVEKTNETDKRPGLVQTTTSTSKSSSSSKHKHATLRGTSSSSKSPTIDDLPNDVFDDNVSDVKVTVAQEKYETRDKESSRNKTLSLRSKIKKESAEASEPRSKRFPFSMEMTTSKQPKQLIEEIKHMLGTWDPPIVFNIVTPFFLVCEVHDGSLTFEIEVCQLPHLSLRGIRLHKIKGDSWKYKTICKSIMEKLNPEKKQ